MMTHPAVSQQGESECFGFPFDEPSRPHIFYIIHFYMIQKSCLHGSSGVTADDPQQPIITVSSTNPRC